MQTVSISPSGVTLRSGRKALQLPAQWGALYGLLALHREDGRWLDAEVLNRYATWTTKSLRSVGREVARHVDELEASGWSDWIEFPHRGKTRRWRLAPAVEVLGELRDLRRRIEEQGALAEGAAPEWIEECSAGLLQLLGGRTRQAFERFRRAAGGTSAAARIARYYALLAAERSALDPVEEGLEPGAWGSDPLGRALEARAASLATFREYDDPKGASAELARLANRLKATGDLAGAGVVLTRLGLLARRAGDYERAELVLQEALGYLLLSGDLWFLQAALFNLGHARYLRLRAQGLPADAQTVAILRSERAFRRDHLLGMDSAQTEIVLASIAATQGDLEAADAYLGEVEAILAAHPDDYDRACWLRQKARLAELRQDRSQALRHLRDAHDAFARAGHTVGAVEAEIRRLRRAGVKG